MIDLMIFASAAAIAKYISQRNPLLHPRPSIIEKDENSNRIKAGQSYIDQGYQSSIASTNTPIHRLSTLIFHSCLLISLQLFALSILEAAPVSWLLLFDRSSLFILWYRTLLWALCILLVFVHPAFVGVILGASLFAKKPSADNNTSSGPPSPGRKSSSLDGRSRSRKRPLVICCNILRIITRFILVTICWRLVRKIVGSIIPYRITRADSGARAKRKQYYSWCNFGVVLTALISLTLSLLSLASVGSLVLHYDTGDSDGFISGDSEPIEENHNTQSRSALDYISLKFLVSVITSFGMIVASILNGFGCASLPHSNLVGLFLKPTSLTVIAKVEEDFHYAIKQLEEKQWMLADITAQSSSTRQSSSYTPSKTKALDDKARRKQLQDETTFLENLVGDMKDDIEEMKASQKLAVAARTTVGRIRGVLGVVFSVVLIIRVLLAARSFMYILEGYGNTADAGTSDSRDILTNILMWLLGRNIVNAEQYDLFKQGTSLLLAGILSMSQVRAFFRVVHAVGRKLSRACGATLPTCITQRKTTQTIGHRNNLALLLSSFVMGCYFLACVTVVKMTLPIEYRSSFTAAVGLNFNSFNRKLLDMIFFGSACISAAILASLFGIQRSHSDRYQLDSQLSMPVSSQLA